MFQIKCKDSDKTELIPAREAADKCHYSILAKFFDEGLSDEENSKDATDKDEDKTSEIKELTSRENYVLRARQWCTTVREKTKRKRETSTSSNPSDKGTQNQKREKGSVDGSALQSQRKHERSGPKTSLGKP